MADNNSPSNPLRDPPSNPAAERRLTIRATLAPYILGIILLLVILFLYACFTDAKARYRAIQQPHPPQQAPPPSSQK